jgi:hypothetical protein
MLDPAEKPYRQLLEDGLALCTAADEKDVERVAAFNGALHGPEVAAMTRNLFIHHPSTRGRDLAFVVDESSDQIVPSLCLIPWTWRYEEVEIPTGELVLQPQMANSGSQTIHWDTVFNGNPPPDWPKRCLGLGAAPLGGEVRL